MARVEPRTFSFEELIEQVRNGVLRVPRFQRGFVWRQDQVLQLFESIKQRYPIGSLLIWRTRGRYSSFGQLGPIAVPDNEPMAPAEVGYVLDGHQRLSTLYGVLALSEETALALKGSQRVFLVYYDLSTEKFAHVRVPNYCQLPLRYLLAAEDHLTPWIDSRRDKTLPNSAERAKWDLWRRRALTLQTTFAQYRVPYLDVTDAELDEAVNIFWRLNSQGSRVRRAEVFAALTWQDGAFDFMGAATRLLQEFPSFTNFGTEPILRALLASLDENIYADDWETVLDTHKSSLPGKMDEVREAFARAIDFLAQSIGALSGRVVPYALQLVLLTEFFRLCQSPDAESRRQLEHWLWASSFSAAYSLGGSLSFNEAIARARRLARGERISLLDGQPLLRAFPRKFHPKSARVRAFHLFLKALEPRDLRTGLPIPRDELLRSGMADARAVATQGENGWLMASRLLVGAGRRNVLEDLRVTSMHPERAEILASHALPEPALDALLAGNESLFLKLRERELVAREQAFAAKYVDVPLDPSDTIEDEAEIDVDEDAVDSSLT